MRKPRGNPHHGRDPVVVEGVFDEEHHAQKKREAASPGKELRPHELLPIDQTGRRRRRRGAHGKRRRRLRNDIGRQREAVGKRVGFNGRHDRRDGFRNRRRNRRRGGRGRRSRGRPAKPGVHPARGRGLILEAGLQPADPLFQVPDLDKGDDAPDQQPANERQKAEDDERDHGRAAAEFGRRGVSSEGPPQPGPAG